MRPEGEEHWKAVGEEGWTLESTVCEWKSYYCEQQSSTDIRVATAGYKKDDTNIQGSPSHRTVIDSPRRQSQDKSHQAVDTTKKLDILEENPNHHHEQGET